MSYVYIEYPKCLYQRSGETVTVTTAEEEAARVADGYLTAEQYGREPELPSVSHADRPLAGGVMVKKRKKPE